MCCATYSSEMQSNSFWASMNSAHHTAYQQFSFIVQNSDYVH